jgi:transposase
MSKRIDGQARGKYTLEFKLEAVRLGANGAGAPACQLARVTMERDILKKATAYFARESL